MDKISSERRSASMRRIRSRNTSPELIVRRALTQADVRYRLQRRDLPGTPDIVIPPLHLAIFVHGCFWHRHKGCKRAFTPATREEFWRSKLNANVERDEKVKERLSSLGWHVLVIWECDTKDVDRLQGALEGATRAYGGGANAERSGI